MAPYPDSQLVRKPISVILIALSANKQLVEDFQFFGVFQTHHNAANRG